MSISIVDIPVSQLTPNPHNPRRDVGDVRELADSIRAQGIKQELLVTPAGDRDGRPMYRVVIGHRRLAAAKIAGLDMVPCRVEGMTAREERELMLVENTQRVDLTPLEEADGYQGLLDLGVKVKEMAERTGRSMRLVRGRLKIASIPRSVREASPSFAQLSLRELEDIAEFDGDEKAQARLAAKAGSNDFEWQRNQLRRERDRREQGGRVVKAYSLFARPLPVVDKDPEHGVYTLNVAENALELRRRQSVPSRRGVELLLLLLARREGAIDADTWDREAYQCDLKGLNAYYEVLESAGYAVSDAERKGLEQ